MTKQTGEILNYQGEVVTTDTQPLSYYFAMSGFTREPFELLFTSCWRGYVGSWEIVNERLYLVGLRGLLADRPNELGSVSKVMEAIFSGFPDRVFAHWYSGTICIPQGTAQPTSIFGVFRFERELLLDVERGVIVATRVRHNETAQSKNGSTSTHYLRKQLTLRDIKKIAVDRQHLQERLTVQEIEQRENVIDPLKAVPELPFGHLNAAWRHFLNKHSDDGELWSFSARCQEGDQKELRSGYVMVLNETPGAYFLTVWGDIPKETEADDLTKCTSALPAFSLHQL